MGPHPSPDLVVIGAGHAGIEAALVAARSNQGTVVLTLNLDRVGHMPCNPSIGGPAKGHLVREIDALGGEMGLAADQTYLQARWLNTRKGPSVRALRFQSDKHEYSRRMLRTLRSQPGVTLVEDQAVSIESVPDPERLGTGDGPRFRVRTALGTTYEAKAVVVATGTFLRGRCHSGPRQWDAGRRGEAPALRLADSLLALGYRVRRLKTGTPPRIDRRTVDFSVLERQDGIEPAPRFSYLSGPGDRDQLPCWILRTTARTKEIIEKHLATCPLFNGQIQGTGPRYCPSIEDKFNKFRDKETHPLFLEPEGTGTDELYVQGLSTSMDEAVQLEVLRSLPGLAQVKMVRPGYAVEYDALDARQLHPTLESKRHPGLFFAGQVCGTSGYEEAAGQGVLAGINAVRRIRDRPPLILTRQESYIGVMVDDLTTQGHDEPYRIFTGRAEFRLTLRHDNADLRLTPKVIGDPHVSAARRDRLAEKTTRMAALRAWVDRAWIDPDPALDVKEKTPLTTVLRRPGMSLEILAEQGIGPAPGQPRQGLPDREATEEVELDVRYESYVQRQQKGIDQTAHLETWAFPSDFPFDTIKNLSFEGRQKLLAQRPSTLGQASRLPGVRPADIALLVHTIRTRYPGPDHRGDTRS